MNFPRLYWIASCAVALAACSSAQSEWSKAAAANTIPAYQHFLAKYPNDVHAIDAQSRIVSLQDDQVWTKAQVASSIQGYQEYLKTEPNGAHAQAARDEVTTRERDAAWNTAQAAGTAQALQDFLQKYPTGSEADQAREKLKTLAGYLAQLATAHSQHAADRKRDALAKRFTKAVPQVQVLAPDANDREYRITSAPMSEHDADAACASLKHDGQSCKVIQAPG
ncbi:MAG TPA: hypothetical protein VK437_07385 [Steroidobacteraceae bacterium]|nr:hypothetical protein [Steroidobacteraceae bacterium]